MRYHMEEIQYNISKLTASVENDNTTKPFINFILNELGILYSMFDQQDSYNMDISKRLKLLENQMNELEKKNK